LSSFSFPVGDRVATLSRRRLCEHNITLESCVMPLWLRFSSIVFINSN
jgi:hypothetical protein